MEEKGRLLIQQDNELPYVSIPQKASKSRRRGKWLLVTIATLLAVSLWTTRLFSVSHHHHHECQHSTLRQYNGESIKWKDCGYKEDTEGLECSSIQVPMDHFNRDRSDDNSTKTFSIPLIRLRGNANATENLIVNPGGPGGSGLSFVRRAGKRLRSIVGDELHIVSFDPRGVGDSRPAASCFPDERTRGLRDFALRGSPYKDAPGFWAWNGNFARACADGMGEFGRHVNTPQTAADMNDVLDALGQRDMVYWGFSYGSLLGQTYATMFPERSDRVIVDGVVNQFRWYDELIESADFVDTENVLHGFFEECVKAGPESCALAGLADDDEHVSSSSSGSKSESASAAAKSLETRVMSFLRDLEKHPKSVYVNSSTYGVLDWDKMLIGALFSGMYKPSVWHQLAANLASLLRGNGTDALLAYVLADETTPPVVLPEQVNFITVNDGVSGPAAWPSDLRGLLDVLAPLRNVSIFAPFGDGTYFAKARWVIPTTHKYKPQRGVETRRPLLILSTTYDPICPLVSARTARDAFRGSRLIEVKGYGHCSISVQSKCMADHVRAFLRSGTLPAKDEQCEVDGPYFIKPEEQAKAKSEVVSDSEDVGAAQQAVADALYGRRWF